MPRPVVEDTCKRLLADCIETYNAEIQEHKAQRSFAAYSKTLGLFAEVVKKKFIEDITREDVLAYITFLRKQGNQPRTVRNRVDYFQIFLHHFGLPSLLLGKDLPKFTEKKVRAYNEYELGLAPCLIWSVLIYELVTIEEYEISGRTSILIARAKLEHPYEYFWS